MQRKINDIRDSFRDLLYRFRIGMEILCLEPKLAVRAILVLGASYIRFTKSPKILVGTHHKVLTVFMIRIFKTFAKITNRSISVGTGDNVDYSADIIFDHHSQFDFSSINFEYLGVHFCRDPRHLLISSGFYYKCSNEPQLHVPDKKYGGKTYQQYINAMDSMEEVFLFELDHSAGNNIRQMLDWNYKRGFVELKFEDLVNPKGSEIFYQEISNWPLSTLEKSLLEGLFDYYSIFGGRGKKADHVRDPQGKKFKEHFSKKLKWEFDTRFPDALNKLGY